MPRFDGTGPLGQGAMTGGGRGMCAGYVTPRDVPSAYGRGRFGYGRGWTRGFGRGLGRGFGWRGYSVPYGGAVPINRQEEMEILKDQAQTMQDEINAVNQRIKDLQQTKGE